MPQEKFGFLDPKLNIKVHFKKFVSNTIKQNISHAISLDLQSKCKVVIELVHFFFYSSILLGR